MNVGTIHSDGLVNVILGRRRIGGVEEGFVKGLKLGDIFVLAGKTVKLIETGVGEIFVENAGGRLPTVPAWNANKMPLASGLAREVAALRTETRPPTRNVESQPPDDIRDWLVERWSISQVNAAADDSITSRISSSFQRNPDGQPDADRDRFRDEEDDPDRVHFFLPYPDRPRAPMTRCRASLFTG